jgi:hypothetical protein
MRSVIVVGLGLLALCAGHGLAEAPAPAEKAAPAFSGPKWEYKALTREEITELGQKDLTAGLNKLGDEGWEMVGAPALPVAAFRGGPGGAPAGRAPEFYFKRPKGRAVEDGKAPPPKVEAVSEDWVILKLKAVSAVDLARTADALFGSRSGGGPRLVAEPTTNSVLARGSAKQIEELRRLITALDVPEALAGSADPAAQVEVLRLKYAQVADLVKVLRDVYGKDTKAYRMGADERTNSLVLSGAQKQLEEVRRLVKELDIPGPKDGGDRRTP